MRVITDDKSKINELFVRLNRSKPLTGAEIRNAMTGPVPEIIRVLVMRDMFKSCIRFPVKRGQDKNAAAKLLLFEHAEKMTETKRRNLDLFTEEARRATKNKLELASRRVVDTLDRMSGIFLPRDLLLAAAGTLPVYYWFIRQRKLKEDAYIREFLVHFERGRKANRATAPGGSPTRAQNAELVEYDEFNRNTNDIRSHEGRVRILEKHFAHYMRTTKTKS